MYRTLGSDTDRWWTADEITDHTGLDIIDIGQTLRTLAAAGVLHEHDRQAQRREYRWHDELRYLFDRSEPTADLIDPVCGMPVSPDSAHTGRDRSGAIVRFCSRWCQATYRARARRP